MPATLSAAKLRFVRHCTKFPDPKSYFGLDLGQRHDHSALAGLELSWIAQDRCPLSFEFLFEPRLTICYLKRFPIGVSYEDLYDLIESHLNAIEMHPKDRQLIIDAGGPGPPVVDRLRRNLSGKVAIKPVIITGGKGANTLSGGYIGLPRRTIVSNFKLLFGAESIRCKPNLEGVSMLKEELLELAGESTQPANGTAHDDLAIATGLAAWAATVDYPELLPEMEQTNQPIRRGMWGEGRLF
jgi:hypothetical protein